METLRKATRNVKTIALATALTLSTFVPLLRSADLQSTSNSPVFTNAINAESISKSSSAGTQNETRLYIDTSASLGPAFFEFHGFESIDNFDRATFYGNNLFGIGFKALPITATVRVDSFGNEKPEVTYGFRLGQSILPNSDYGKVEATSNLHKAIFRTLVGKVHTRILTSETTLVETIPYKGKSSFFVESQVLFGDLAKTKLRPFLMVDMTDLDRHSVVGYAGLRLKR